MSKQSGAIIFVISVVIAVLAAVTEFRRASLAEERWGTQNEIAQTIAGMAGERHVQSRRDFPPMWQDLSFVALASASVIGAATGFAIMIVGSGKDSERSSDA